MLRFIFTYLVIIATATALVTALFTALAGDATCHIGTYGKIAAQQQGRC